MINTAEFIQKMSSSKEKLIIFVQAGTQISLADLSFSDETCTLWYNLLSCKQIPGKKNKDQNEEPMFLLSKQSSDSLDLVSEVLTVTVLARKKTQDLIVPWHYNSLYIVLS